ncbi:MAG: alpha/beta hydrolase [Bacteroidia bacterium]
MNNFEFQAGTGENMHVREWLPGAEAKGVIALVHGIGEHGGRYEHLADWFGKKGMATLTLDYFGHGKSEGKRGYIPSYEAVLDVVGKFLDEVKKRHPGKPVVMYGHSLGGNFTSNFVLKRKPDIAGLVLSAPWFRLAFKPNPVEVLLAKIMINVFPKFTQNNGLDMEALSRDPKVAERYIADPDVHYMVGPAIYLGGKAGGEYALSHSREFEVPVLLMHGSMDRLTSYEASAEMAEKNKDLPGFTWKSWNGFYHELHNEPEQEEVFDYVWEWMAGLNRW